MATHSKELSSPDVHSPEAEENCPQLGLNEPLEVRSLSRLMLCLRVYAPGVGMQEVLQYSRGSKEKEPVSAQEHTAESGKGLRAHRLSSPLTMQLGPDDRDMDHWEGLHECAERALELFSGALKVARTEFQGERWNIHCGDECMETKPWEKQSSCKKAGLGPVTLATSVKKVKVKPHLLHPGSSTLPCLPLTRAPTTANLSSSHRA